MTSTRRVLGPAMAFLAALGVMVGFAASASAAPYTTQTTVSVSNQNPSVGGTITISGSGFAANETIDITLHSAVSNLGTATADPSGSFTATVTLPAGVSGTHTIVATGATSGQTASVTITIGATSVAAPGPGVPAPGAGGGLPMTGVAVIGIGSVGVALLVAGAILLVAGRGRRANA